jgi:hypothetical protein
VSNWVKVFFQFSFGPKRMEKQSALEISVWCATEKGFCPCFRGQHLSRSQGALKFRGLDPCRMLWEICSFSSPAVLLLSGAGRLLSSQRAARWAQCFLSASECEKVQVGIRPAHCEAKGAQNRLNLALRAGRSKTRGTSSSVHRPVCFKFPTLYSGLRRCRGSSPGRSFHRR